MLHIRNLTKQYGPKVLFQDAEANFGARSRVALIGPNGAGKSTFLKILLNQEAPDTGEVSRAKGLSLGYLPQEVPKASNLSVLDECLRMGDRVDQLKALKVDYEKKFQDAHPDDEDLERYGRVVEELEGLDEFTLEARAKEILMGMGFRLTDFNRPLTEFSGGWLMRVALSRLLLMQPDLLLLDEPTNHLDLESLLWLEQFLARYQGAMLIISHDRPFLNRIVNEVIEIDQKRFFTYKGNLDSYVVQKQERIRVLRAQYESQQVRIAEIEDFVRRFGAKATKARQAQSRLKELDRMERIELEEDSKTVRFRFPPAPHSGKEVITLKNTTLSFPSRVLFKNLNWILKKGARVAIVGINGAGKTSLLRMLSQDLTPSNGECKLGHEVKLGYYAQIQAEALNPRHTIFEELSEVAPMMPQSQIRGIAGAFLFQGDDVFKRCSVLSGGEKARVALGKLLLSPANLLILDEPTNHLDADSRDVLLEALVNYKGTLILVSHDREFIAPLVDSVLEVVPAKDGVGPSDLHHLLGTYDEYLERKEKEIAQQSRPVLSGKSKPAAQAAPVKEAPKPIDTKTPSNNQRKKWKEEIEAIESEIQKLDSEKVVLEKELAQDQTYEDPERAQVLAKRQTEIHQILNSKLSRWEELSSLVSE